MIGRLIDSLHKQQYYESLGQLAQKDLQLKALCYFILWVSHIQFVHGYIQLDTYNVYFTVPGYIPSIIHCAWLHTIYNSLCLISQSSRYMAILVAETVSTIAANALL